MTKGLRMVFGAGLLLVAAAGEAMKAEVTGVSAEFVAYLQQHPCAVAPLDRFGDSNEQTVDVRINGEPVTMIFDSGASHSVISSYCARRLHLKVQATKNVDVGTGGKVRGFDSIALVPSFTVNGYPINRPNTITVLPTAAKLSGYDGLFGLDLMHLNGVIFPVGGHCFLFKPGAEPRSSMDVYLRRLGFRGIPLRVEQGGFVANGHLNGQPFRARIDSGAMFTFFDRTFARKVLGDDSISITHLRGQGVDGEVTTTYRFTPSSLDLEGVSIPPTLVAAADDPGVTSMGVNGLFGFDLLSLHGAYIDTMTGTLWMK